MPRKKTNSANVNMKTIQARLMHVNIKVDGYVYYDRPIPVAEAKAYIEEIKGFKSSCVGNERFMQVIDKLFQLLRRTIAEHEPGSANSNETPHNESRSDSPVYSLPEEDRIIYSHTSENSKLLNSNNETEEVRRVEGYSKKTTINTKFSDVPKDFGEKNNFSENPRDDNVVIERVDIYNDALDEHSQQSIYVGNVGMQKPLPNISVRETDTDTVSLDIECSQSILKLIDNNNDTFPSIDTSPGPGQVNQLNGEKPQVLKIPSAKDNILKSPITNIPLNDNLAKKTTYLSKPAVGDINLLKLNEESIVYQIIESAANTVDVPQKKNVRNKRNQNKIKSDKKNKIKNQITTKTKKQNEITTKTKKRSKKNIINTDTTVQSEEINNKTPQVATRRHDLSWVEGIRFLREIAIEEFDSKLCLMSSMFDDK